MIRIGYPVRNYSHVCAYYSFLDVLICFHASNSIRNDAQIFVTVRKLSLRFVIVR